MKGSEAPLTGPQVVVIERRYTIFLGDSAVGTGGKTRVSQVMAVTTASIIAGVTRTTAQEADRATLADIKRPAIWAGRPIPLV